MLGSKLLAEFYEGGTLINFRLAPEDYHHFHFPFDAKASSSQKIAGSYNSVNPYIFKQGGDPLGENARNILVLKSENFCDPLFIIVGAMGVGKIIETYKPDILYKKGDDMGYFQFGASTVCMLFRKGVIKPGNDKLVTNSRNHIETAVKQGERIAIKANQEPQEISIFWLSFTKLTTFFTRALQKLTHWF
jgi:phosphatidylserine decarboxylase